MKELRHYGIVGMKWGIRRYQNPDGSLTELGMRRYRRDVDRNMQKKPKDRVANEDLRDPQRWVEEDITRSKNATDNAKTITNAVKDLERATRTTNKERMNLSELTDAEMRAKINRELLERQYNDLFNPATVSKGRQTLSKTLDIAGDVLAVTSSALAIALAIKRAGG